MAENPLAIRVSENVKVLFNELADAGEFENKGEFLSRLLIQYQLETAKKDVSIMKPAIEAVETLMGRLLEVLNGTAATILTKDEKHRQEIEDTRMPLQERIAELEQGRTEDAEHIQVLASGVEIAETRAAEFLDKIRRLESALHDKDALLKEYNDKIDTQRKLDDLLNLLDERGKATKPSAARGKAAAKETNNS